MNNQFRLLLVALGFVVLIGGQPSFSQHIECLEYEEMLEKRLPKEAPVVYVDEVNTNTPNLVFLDTREKEEYTVSHIEKAIHVGYTHLDLSAVEKLPKNTPIVVYCSIGYRSGKVTEKLVDAGFTNVKNLFGGIFEWSNQERLLVDQDGNVTQKVHAYNKRWGKWITHGDKVYN